MIHTSPTTRQPPQPDLSDDYDVIVIGAGPAGSTVAALTARHGHRTLVLDRARFPRFHVGESLIPETWWTLDRLGLIDQLKASAYPRKYSVQFVSDGIKESAPFYFDLHKPHDSSQTWQVERATFDQMLLDKAVTNGAVAHTAAQVLDVLITDDRATGVRLRNLDDTSQPHRTISCRVVVDATGQSAFLANRLGLRQPDARLKKGTVWSYFRGAQRDTGKDEGATIIMQTPGKNSWFWYIPLPDDIVSVGCTGSLKYMFNRDRGTAENVFAQELANCPAMQCRLHNATRETEFLTTKDFSYTSSRGAGDGWLLVGDAFGFIDPVYSTGVFLALKSGELAADAIHDALSHADVSANRLGAWQTEYRKGVDLFRRLVYAFYTPNFSFGTFLRDHPQYKSNLVDVLIGDVFKPGVGEMFDAMGPIVPPADEPLTVESSAV